MNDSGVITADQSQRTIPTDSQSHGSLSQIVSGTTVTSGGEGDRRWLDRNVVVQYWEGQRDGELDGRHRYSTVAQQWSVLLWF